MGKKNKKPPKYIGDLLPSREERNEALEEYNSHLGGFDNLFDDDDEDGDD